MSTYADKITTLAQRLSEIGAKITGLDERRRQNSFDASQGNKTALKAIAALDTETEQLYREQQTLSQALDAAEQLTKAEQQAIVDKAEHERQREARTLAANAATLNDEIDALSVKLCEACERRIELHQLSRLDVVDRMLVNRMLGKDPLTRALQYHGIHRFAAIMVGAPTSAAPMAQANKLLASFGGGYVEPDKVKRVKLDE